MDGVYLLSILTLVTNVVFVGLIALYLLAKMFKGARVYWSMIEKFAKSNGLKVVFILALVSTLGSLYFSEIRGFEPCKLCWFQRIFMYPLTLISGVAFIKKLKESWIFILPMSVIGLLIASYHYYYQVTGNSFIPCSTVGFSVSCSERFFTYFGYITIPWMALSAFLYIASITYLLQKKSR